MQARITSPHVRRLTISCHRHRRRRPWSIILHRPRRSRPTCPVAYRVVTVRAAVRQEVVCPKRDGLDQTRGHVMDNAAATDGGPPRRVCDGQSPRKSSLTSPSEGPAGPSASFPVCSPVRPSVRPSVRWPTRHQIYPPVCSVECSPVRLSVSPPALTRSPRLLFACLPLSTQPPTFPTDLQHAPFPSVRPVRPSFACPQSLPSHMKASTRLRSFP